MKEQDAAHSLIENEFYWIKIQQWKDRDTRIEDKWSVAKWDGESFEELNEMYRTEEVIEIGEKIPSNAELTRLRSELQDTKDYFEKAQKHLIDEHFSELQQERELRKELIQKLTYFKHDTGIIDKSNWRQIEALMKKQS